MKNYNLLGIFLATALFYGCSSAPVQTNSIENAGQEKVLSRIDGLDARPEWVKESEPFRLDNSKVISIGMATIPADHRLEAGFRLSENNGRAAVANAIEQKFEAIFQTAEQGTSIDENQITYLSAEATKLTTNSVRVGRRYWEKVSIIQENGLPVVRYKLFSEITMPENEFKAAIADAIRKAKGKGTISQELAKRARDQLDRMTETTDRSVAKENQ